MPADNKLTAWERWELASLEAPAAPAGSAGEGSAVPAPPTADELADLRQTGREQGYKEGYRLGQEAAREEARRLGSAVAHLDQALAQIDQQVADELLALALEIARQVIRGELTLRPQSVLDIVQQALAQLPHQHATVYLCPSDASLLRSYLGDSLGHAGHRIHEDARLKPGDCLVEAGNSQIEATVANRWRRVVESMGLQAAWQEEGGE